MESYHESRMEQNNILAIDPMIRLLISDMNNVSGDGLKEIPNINRKNFLIQVQAFQELIGYSIGFEDIQIIGKNGDVFFSLSNVKDKNPDRCEVAYRGIEAIKVLKIPMMVVISSLLSYVS